MRGAPWAYDGEPRASAEKPEEFQSAIAGPPMPYDGNHRPACLKWTRGDLVLAPWFRKTDGVTMLYERTGGARAGEVKACFLPQHARRLVGDSAFNLVDALRQSYPFLEPQARDLEALADGEGFKVIGSREAWRYSDPKPGVEEVTCQKCLALILEVQGARADYLAERAATIATRAVEAELNAQREQALLERGTCPMCSGELGRHDFEGLRVCRPCGFEWIQRRRAGLGGSEQWELLNSTNRGTDATT